MLVAVAVAGCGDDDSSSSEVGVAVTTSSAGPGGASTAAATSTSEPTVPTAVSVPLDTRGRLRERLTVELGDGSMAAEVVDGLSDSVVEGLEALAGGDLEGSPMLSYSPTMVPADSVDSLWVFSFGYRFAPGAEPPNGGDVPPIDALVPGPTNEELARVAAAFVADHPVPVIAQWEVAQVLESLGVPGAISVEPDVAPDGTITYLSTSGVTEKGLRLAAEAGVAVGHAGVLCHADHAVRCLLTARARGLTADVPDGVVLPTAYEPESGQEWTSSRVAFIPVDLLGRTVLAG